MTVVKPALVLVFLDVALGLGKTRISLILFDDLLPEEHTDKEDCTDRGIEETVGIVLTCQTNLKEAHLLHYNQRRSLMTISDTSGKYEFCRNLTSNYLE